MSLKIGDWLVSPESYRITNDYQTKKIEPRLMAVLMCLKNHPGKILSQQDLVEHVWEGAHISETMVRRAISKLREVLGDNAKNPEYIETLPKKGYRLIAPVVVLPAKEEETLPEHLAKAVGIPTPVKVEPTKTPKSNTLQKPLAVLVLVLAMAAGYFLRDWIRMTEPSFSGKQEGELIEFTKVAGEPDFSGDGSMIAFTLKEPGVWKKEIHMVGADRNRWRRVITGAGNFYSPSWSPNDEAVGMLAKWNRTYRVGFIRESDFGEGKRHLRVLYETDKELMDLDWSPVSDQMVMSSRMEDQPYRLLTINSINGKEIATLTTPPANYLGDLSAVYSPGGKEIAFIRHTGDGASDVFILPAMGGEVRRLTYMNREMSGLAFGTEDTLVASIMDNGQHHLYRIKRTGQPPEKLEDLGPHVRAPAAHGPWLAYQKLQVTTDLMALRLQPASTSPNPFTVSSNWDTATSFSPDGKKIAFMSTRSGSPEIWTMDVSGENAMQLTSFGGPFTSNPSWSPDSEMLVFESQESGSSQIFLLEMEGGRQRRLTHGEDEHRLPVWAENGGSIYFTSNREDGWQIWRTTTSGGAAERITDHGGYRSKPVGSWLYYSKYRRDGLWRQPLAGGAETQVIDLHEDQWGNWEFYEGLIYFISQEEDSLAVKVYDPETEATAMVSKLFETPENPSLTISPDGKRLIFASKATQRARIMLKKLSP